MKLSWKTIQPHLLAIGIFLVFCLFQFYPQLQGKVLSQSDLLSFKAMTQEVNVYKEETGKTALWSNSMFGGMPTYQMGAPQKTNLVGYIYQAHILFFGGAFGVFFAAMLAAYLLLIAFGVRSHVAILGAVAFAFSTNNLVLFVTGHTSKMAAVVFAAYLIAGVYLAYRKNLILGGIVFALGVGLSFRANHPQMTYYTFLVLGLIGVWELVRHIRSDEVIKFIKASAILIAGLVIGMGSSASKLMTTLEYAEDTMRGKPILETQGPIDPSNSSQTDGLAWNYAMGWSNGWNDLMGMLVPNAVGGSNSEVVKNSSTIQNLRSKGINVPVDQPIPLYWGNLGLTSGPVYLGAILLFLFVASFFWVQRDIKWWFLIGVVILTLISLGNTLPKFNKLLFDTLPYLNKFRAPSSSLSVVALFVPILSALGLNALINGKLDQNKILQGIYWGAGVTGGLSLLLMLLGPSMFSFSGEAYDAAYQGQGFDLTSLKADRKSALSSSALRSLAFIILGAGACWFYAKEKIKSNPLFLGLIGLLIVIDLFGVGRKYLNSDSYVEKRQQDQTFRPSQADEQILKDPDLYYRVHHAALRGDPFQNAIPSYFHKTVGGYHPAKLQRFEDVKTMHLMKGNQAAFDMLNTKYFVLPGQNNQPRVQQNPGALGNAWFVENITIVNSNEDEINQLSEINPGTTALIHEEFESAVSGLDPTPNGSISLTAYAPDELTFNSNTTSEQLAVFSDVWYGPNKGWQAYIDGEEAEHIRANYLLRAMRIPAGQHTIEFKFRPKSYTRGELIALICSLLILAGLGYVLFRAYKGTAANETPTEKSKSSDIMRKSTSKTTKTTKTKSKRKKK